VLVLGLALVVLLAAVSCVKPSDNPPINNDKGEDTIVNPPEKPCNCIMDTLKGEWIWVRLLVASSAGIGTYDSSFTSIIKILSQNADSSVNYEVWIKDTLRYQGNFQFIDTNVKIYSHDYYHHGVVINIKHFRHLSPPWVLTERWNMLFTNEMPRREPNEIKIDTTDYPLLVLWNAGFHYYYQKMK